MLRPQDLVILLKIISLSDDRWMNKDIASSLFLSPSEISISLSRSEIAGLLDNSRRHVRKQALVELLVYGVPYILPQIPGSVTLGVPTAHSHEYFIGKISSSEMYVWPDAESNYRGFSVEPLYSNVAKAAKLDEKLYLYLALIDVLRMGKVREKGIAIDKLKHDFDESPY